MLKEVTVNNIFITKLNTSQNPIDVIFIFLHFKDNFLVYFMQSDLLILFLLGKFLLERTKVY